MVQFKMLELIKLERGENPLRSRRCNGEDNARCHW